MLVLLDVSAPVALAALTVGHSYFYYLFWVHFVSVVRRIGISPSRAVATGLAAFFGKHFVELAYERLSGCLWVCRP